MAVLEVAPQLRGVGGLALQIELIEDGLLVLADHLDRPEAAPVRPIALRQLREGQHQVDIATDDPLDIRAQDLDDDLLSSLEAAGMEMYSSPTNTRQRPAPRASGSSSEGICGIAEIAYQVKERT